MIPDEREWLAQERALHCERNAIDLADVDTLSAEYLPIARALRQPLEPMLPADFASRVARMANSQTTRVDVEFRFEQWLLLALAAIMGVSALIAVMVYGSNWFGSLESLAGQFSKPTLVWPLALLGCLGFSWLSQLLRQHISPASRTLA